MLWLSMETVSVHVAKMSSDDTFSTGLNFGMCTEQRYLRKLFCVKIGPWRLMTSRPQEQQSAAMTLRSLRSSIRYSFSGARRTHAGKSLESSNYQVKECSCPAALSLQEQRHFGPSGHKNGVKHEDARGNQESRFFKIHNESWLMGLVLRGDTLP